MKLVPRVLLIAIAALGMMGCRTYGTAPSPRLLPPPEPKSSFDVQEFVSEHNRNAEIVESLQARPQITASMAKQLTGTPLTGALVMERPRNFKLELRSDRGFSKPSVADIGSNDDEFWFWVKNDKDKSLYVCNHDDLPSTPLAVSFQPDWIIDALGLKTISPQEAREIKVKPGADPKTTELVFPPSRSNGQAFARIVTVTNADRRIRTHRLYAADRKTLLAQADISEYQEVSTDGESSDGSPDVVCLLPKVVRLDWKQEQFTLAVNLKEVELNSFDPKQRSTVFVEPKIEGYARVNMANSRMPRDRNGETTIRESVPRPDAKATGGIRLGSPVSESDDSASLERAGLTTAQNRPRKPIREQNEPATSIEAPLRAAVPRAPDGYDYQTAGAMGSDVPPAALSIGR